MGKPNNTAVGIPIHRRYETLLYRVSYLDLVNPITIRYNVEQRNRWEAAYRYNRPEEFRNQVNTFGSLL